MPADEIASVLDLLALPIPDFVDGAYQSMLGRRPAPAEAAERSGALRAGLGRIRFLADLGLSPEFRDRSEGALRDQSDSAFLEQVYLRYLGRQIDPQGMDAYLRFLARGKSRRRLVRQVAASREARIRRTFWFELEQLLADERAQRHWLRRWAGGARRRERQLNRMIEVTLWHPLARGAQAPDAAGLAGSSLPDLHAEAFAALGANARRALSRARHGAAPAAGRA